MDRLGRNYQDVCETIRELLNRGVTVSTVINRMTFDGNTTDPVRMAVRDALIGFMAATAQAQAEATKEAQKAGIAHAKALAATTKYRGRKPSYDRTLLSEVQNMLAQGSGASEIAKATSLTRQTILRIKNAPDKAEAALSAWE